MNSIYPPSPTCIRHGDYDCRQMIRAPKSPHKVNTKGGLACARLGYPA